MEEFLAMPGHIRPPRLNIDKNTKTGELFQIFKEYILDADITTPEGYKLKAKEGHFYSFCCGKKNGRKGHVAKAENSAQALRMVKNSEISQDDIEEFQLARIRDIRTYVNVLTDPDFSYQIGEKIVYGKKFDDIADSQGYTSVVLKISDNEVVPVHSGIERLTKTRLQGKDIKWYRKNVAGAPSDISGDTPTGETSGEQSRGYRNIAQNDGKSSRQSVNPEEALRQSELEGRQVLNAHGSRRWSISAV